MNNSAMETLKTCPLCSGNKIGNLWNIEKRGTEIYVEKCVVCGLIFQNPRPLDPNQFYEEDYYSGKASYSYSRNSDEDLPMWDARLSNIEVAIKKRSNNRILDIGCATGDLLLAASKRGWECWGVDVSSHAVKEASRKVKNAKILTGEIFDCDLPENYFDVITLFEVLEHIANPIALLQKINSLLAPGGIIVIQTSNVNSFKGKIQGKNFYYFEPGHLIYYSVNTLRFLLKKTGFKEKEMWIGSELDLKTELKVFSMYYSRIYIFLKKIFNKVIFGDFTAGTVMVVYGRKNL